MFPKSLHGAIFVAGIAFAALYGGEVLGRWALGVGFALAIAAGFLELRTERGAKRASR